MNEQRDINTMKAVARLNQLINEKSQDELLKEYNAVLIQTIDIISASYFRQLNSEDLAGASPLDLFVIMEKSLNKAKYVVSQIMFYLDNQNSLNEIIKNNKFKH